LHSAGCPHEGSRIPETQSSWASVCSDAGELPTPGRRQLPPYTFPGLPHEFAAYVTEPLVQRPAGSIGKSGSCSLAFAVDHARTFLHSSFVTHPFHLTRPWYSDPALPGMAVVYVQTPAGGLIQGDRVHLHFGLDAKAQVHVTTQAAEKIHSMTANCALQHVSFVIGAGAYAEYCPEPVLLFSGARFGQEMNIELGEGASFFFTEIFLSHSATNSSSFAALSTSLTVKDAAGQLCLRDRSLALPTQQCLDGPGVLGSYRVWGQALMLSPSMSPAWAREIHTLIAAVPQVICGVTTLPGKHGIGIKVVASEVRLVRRVLTIAWDYLRTRCIGAPAPVFPK